MNKNYQNFSIRDWQASDRKAAAAVIHQVLEEYGLPWQPELADRDVIEVESAYLEAGGEFWVVEEDGREPMNWVGFLEASIKILSSWFLRR